MPSEMDVGFFKCDFLASYFHQVAKLCDGWNEAASSKSGVEWPCLGLVVGATDITALKSVRSVSPKTWILCPGVGAQGGEPQVSEQGCASTNH